MSDGDTIRVETRDWRIVVGSGHSPEHACLVDDAGGLMIAGDQVLPRITPTISLSISEPSADPLGEWLDSIAKLKKLPDHLLVLPSHGDPFTGLHARLDALDRGHRERLDALHAHLSEPRRAVDCFPVLFGRRSTRASSASPPAKPWPTSAGSRSRAGRGASRAGVAGSPRLILRLDPRTARAKASLMSEQPEAISDCRSRPR
jgi:glyoxylase-like metal-dependent hydrolase (beta-lactamase superfamily II)